jgi:hypothetical protein
MSKETFTERQTREAHERATVDGLMPGVNDALLLALRKIDAAGDALDAAQKQVTSAIAGNPSARLEYATRLLDMPAAMVAALIEAEGVDYAEHIMVLAEQRLAALREKMRAAVAPKEAA